MILRTLLFNTIYYLGTMVIGVLIVPSLVLPRRYFVPFIRQYFFCVYLCEKYILGLDYTVRGRDLIPQNQPIIIAAKHYSAYETLKLPLLFTAPVVIVKRELLLIPFWGWYAARAGMIGINRAKPREALAHMQAGVTAALAKGQTVIIFPQGTRVDLTATPRDKPYKHGIYLLAKSTGATIIPLAVNSGLYWPRHAFFKKPGRVIFEFLSPLPPHENEESFMTDLEQKLETAANRLVAEGSHTAAHSPANAASPAATPRRPFWTLPNSLMIAATTLIALYAALWFGGAWFIQNQLTEAWAAPQAGVKMTGPAPHVSGFLGAYTLTYAGSIKSPDLTLTLPALRVTFLPLPGSIMTVDLPKGLIAASPRLKTFKTTQLKATSLLAKIEIPTTLPAQWIKSDVQKLHDTGATFRLPYLEITGLVAGGPRLDITGQNGVLTYDPQLQPQAQMDLSVTGMREITNLITKKIKDPMGQALARTALSAIIGQKTNPKTGQDQTDLTLKINSGRIYAGPVLIGSIGRIYWPVQVPK